MAFSVIVQLHRLIVYSTSQYLRISADTNLPPSVHWSVVSGPGSVGAAADTPPVTARRDHCTVRCTVYGVQYSAVQCRTPEHVQCVEGDRRESMCPRTVIRYSYDGAVNNESKPQHEHVTSYILKSFGEVRTRT